MSLWNCKIGINIHFQNFYFLDWNYKEIFPIGFIRKCVPTCWSSYVVSARFQSHDNYIFGKFCRKRIISFECQCFLVHNATQWVRFGHIETSKTLILHLFGRLWITTTFRSLRIQCCTWQNSMQGWRCFLYVFFLFLIYNK